MVDVAFGATAIAAIFAVVDPVGVVPFFAILTEGTDPSTKRRIIARSCLVATLTLGFFGVFGQLVFAAFGFSIPAFEIAGGLMLFAVAFEMMQGQRPNSKLTESEREETLGRDDVSVIPLGIPLIAGPGAITTVMIYMTRTTGDPFDKLFVFAGVAIAILTTFVMMHSADRIFRRIGRTGTRAIGRIMGLLLAAVAIQFIISGVVGAACFYHFLLGSACSQ
jgi:multiple antibiotic resistance protein